MERFCIWPISDITMDAKPNMGKIALEMGQARPCSGKRKATTKVPRVRERREAIPEPLSYPLVNPMNHVEYQCSVGNRDASAYDCPGNCFAVDAVQVKHCLFGS